jgi:hypothetical protein
MQKAAHQTPTVAVKLGGLLHDVHNLRSVDRRAGWVRLQRPGPDPPARDRHTRASGSTRLHAPQGVTRPSIHAPCAASRCTACCLFDGPRTRKKRKYRYIICEGEWGLCYCGSGCVLGGVWAAENRREDAGRKQRRAGPSGGDLPSKPAQGRSEAEGWPQVGQVRQRSWCKDCGGSASREHLRARSDCMPRPA